MLRGRFFFLDVFVDQAWDAAAAKAAGRFVLGFAFGVAHEALIERFFSTDEVVVVESQFAALAALKIFCHPGSFRDLALKCFADPAAAVVFNVDFCSEQSEGPCRPSGLYQKVFPRLCDLRVASLGVDERILTIVSEVNNELAGG